MSSVASYLPEAKRIVCCADRIDGCFDARSENYEVLEAVGLEIPRFNQLALALDPTALCCALKPYAIQIAIKVREIEKVIYIDNDMGLYRRPEELLHALETAPLVLTPHNLEPLAPAAFPNEQILVKYGIFNAGIIGVRKNEESQKILKWWQHTMSDPRCLDKKTAYDQIWLNFAPIYCPQMKVLREKSYNVAFWNLGEREFRISKSGQFKCAKERLTSFHFSNFSEEHPENLVWPPRVSNLRLTKASKCVVTQMVKKWNNAGRSECANWGYGFSFWPDGSAILESERQAARFKWDDIPTGANPWIDVPGSAEAKLLAMIRPCGFKRFLRLWKNLLWKLLDVPPLEVLRRLRGFFFKRPAMSTPSICVE